LWPRRRHPPESSSSTSGSHPLGVCRVHRLLHAALGLDGQPCPRCSDRGTPARW
jgi:hypothetical protein